MAAASPAVEKPRPETIFGFWTYIMTDCMIFAALFATFAVLRTQFAGGPTPKQLFDLKSTLEETMLLLTSSATCGCAMVNVHKRKIPPTLFWLALTLCLGAGFVMLELREFMDLVARGAGPDRSAFLSAFFTLVGTHGLHVTAGLLWMLVLVMEMTVMGRGMTDKIAHRLYAWSLFWHFLDIIWVAIFTFVYLNSVR